MVGLALSACGPSSAEIDQRINVALAGLPTPTLAPVPTLLPTVTPAPTATPQPTPTPVNFPSTPTPVTFPPPPTPQPTATPQPIIDFNAVQEQAQASVFMIETRQNVGTGWLIEPGLILTNEHVINGYSSVTIRQSQFPAFTASVLASDAQHDIALLTFQPNLASRAAGAEPLPLGHISSDNIAQPLLALGYSGGEVTTDGRVGFATANVGVLSQVTNFGIRSHGRNLVMDVPVDPGDSGGPVLNGKGEVVGMTRAVLESTNQGQRVVGTFYAVHIDEIRAALPALKRGESK
ncbi:MAG: serine protease [Chloroflexi bacterium]|nr:serine protease [Chloroflexota bacterium]